MAASAVAAFAVGAVAMASVAQFHDPGTPHRRSCHTALQLALPASMLMLLLAACAITCFDRLTSILERSCICSLSPQPRILGLARP